MTEQDKSRAEFEKEIRKAKNFNPKNMVWKGDRYEIDAMQSAFLGFILGLEHAAARALPADAAPSGWRPIESAPMDFTHVLVSDGKRDLEKAFYDPEIGKWVEAWEGDEDFHDLYKPKYWQPLPASPDA